MKTLVTLESGDSHEFVVALEQSRGDKPGLFQHLGRYWTLTEDGFVTAWDHQLFELPPVLADAPVVRIVIEHSEIFETPAAGTYEPEGKQVRAQVSRYTDHNHNYRRTHSVRVETPYIDASAHDAPAGNELLKGVNDYFAEILSGKAQPTTHWSPQADTKQ